MRGYFGIAVLAVVLSSTMLFVGCGTEDRQFDGFKPLIGTEGAQDYFKDRDMTGEDFQKGTNKIASDTSKGYTTSRDGTGQSAVDNNLTGEDFQKGTNKVADDTDKGYVDGKEKVGATKNKAAGYTTDRDITGSGFNKKANDYYDKTERKGEITKGYTSDRLDQIKDPDRKEREELKELRALQEQERLDRLAAEKLAADRMALIEGVNSLQDAMLAVQSERLDALEANDLMLQADIDGNESAQDEVNTIQAGINSLFSSQISSLMSDLGALTSRVSANEGNLSVQLGLIQDLRSDLSTLQAKVNRLKRKLRRLKRKVRINKSDIAGLESDMYGCGGLISSIEARVATNETNISVLQLDVDAICSFSPGTLAVTFRDNSFHYDHRVTTETVTLPQQCVDVHHDGRRDDWVSTGWFSGYMDPATAPSTEQVCFTDTDTYESIDWNFHRRSDLKTIYTVPVPTVTCPSQQP